MGFSEQLTCDTLVDTTVTLNSNIHLGVAIVKAQLPREPLKLPVIVNQ